MVYAWKTYQILKWYGKNCNPVKLCACHSCGNVSVRDKVCQWFTIGGSFLLVFQFLHYFSGVFLVLWDFLMQITWNLLSNTQFKIEFGYYCFYDCRVKALNWPMTNFWFPGSNWSFIDQMFSDFSQCIFNTIHL